MPHWASDGKCGRLNGLLTPPSPFFFTCLLVVVSFVRETVVRLQSENKMLCAQEETYRQKLVEVQTELEEAQRSKNTLEAQNR